MGGRSGLIIIGALLLAGLKLYGSGKAPRAWAALWGSSTAPVNVTPIKPPVKAAPRVNNGKDQG